MIHALTHGDAGRAGYIRSPPTPPGALRAAQALAPASSPSCCASTRAAWSATSLPLRRVGMKAAIAAQTAAATRPRISAMWKPSAEGIDWPPTVDDMEASTLATTAEATAVPNERIRVFSPLAAPVSDSGTARMISVGIAA